MKKLFTFLSFIILFTSSIFSQQTQKSFKDYGYEVETVITGRRASKSFYFKVNKQFSPEKSFIHLELKRSHVIDFENSYITIYLGDIPILSKYVVKDKEIITFDIPILKKYIKSDFLKLDIKSDLIIKGESCENYSDNGYWIKATEDSYLSMYNIEDKTATIYTKISNIAPVLNSIVLAKNASLQDVQLASYIKFYFERIYGTKLTVKKIDSTQSKQIDRSLLLMPLEQLQKEIGSNITIKDKNNGLVKIYRDSLLDKKTTRNYIRQNLIITGSTKEAYTKAATFLLQKNLINTAYTDELLVSQKNTLSSTPTRKEYEPVYFNELDADPRIIKGVGNLVTKINLPRSYFGSNVKKMMVKITGKYKPLSGDDEAYFNLFFNERLINTYKLNNSGELDINFEFSDIAMLQENVFNYEFYYLPKDGICGAKSVFYAQVDTGKSYFKPIGYESSSSLSFTKFPENFQSKPIHIYTDVENNIGLVDGLAELIDIINPGEAGLEGFIYPPVKKANLKDIIDNDESSKIIISSNYEKFNTVYDKNLYVKFNNSKVEYRSETIDPFFNITYNKNLGFNQLFYANNNPVMLINTPKNNNKKTLKSLIVNIREQTAINTGNIIIADGKDSYFFDLRNNVVTEDKSYIQDIFDNFWDNYGLIIVLMLTIFLIFLVIYIYQKSQESKKSIRDDD
ncbi:hypothetical protein FHR24_001117 [Wenyingzhuangia heitensis]|uniref:Cellulose synthase subunit n=1 Tax=Wenyingzhuangia heitensis TaxID=1487859 RepID=A0ABX0U7E2_9FLAO|nr:cellulose biosynthesis cyclic di-GMP-binding regulatory protein BcsB [Wenyingzhuangia heitensis]NIJ44678.1 hypothetical protein [Wenyingzhuangia heitensis]